MRLSRRQFLIGSAAAVTGGGVTGVYGHREANHAEVRNLDIELDRLPAALDGFQLVQLSDIHYENYTTPEYLRAVVAQVNALQPKIVVVTGDFITKTGDTDKAAQLAEPCGRILRGLTAPLGVYCTLGNHDAWTNGPAVVRALRDSGLIALDNQSHPIEYSGKRFWFLGTGSMLHGDAKLWECVRGVPQDEVRVLLAHEPDLADEIGKYKIDLQLSGHSHGGQIRFPGIGAMYLPPLGRKYPAGLYHLSTHKLYTNIGIGCIGIPVRLGCPPEITRITLRSKKS